MSSLVYWEIPSTDVLVSARFYSELFGWTVEPSDGDYHSFDTDGGIAGGINPVDDIPAGCIEVYIGVDDIPGTLAKVEALGGSILQTKVEVGGEHGYMAFFADPCGCRIGIWSRE